MTTERFAVWREWFDRYVDGYSMEAADEADRYGFEVKREHSRNVCREAAMIADESGLTGEDALAARLAGLFHDLGRFPQFARYKTFNDAASVDHARLSVATLLREGVLADLSRPLRTRILGAITVHNKRLVPRALDGGVLPLALLLRDADKLDIARVLLEHFAPEGPKHDVVTMALPDEPGVYSPAVMERLRTGRLGDSRDMRVLNDFKLLLMGWAYDLNTVPARRAWRERGVTGRLLELLPDIPEIAAAGARVEAHLASRVDPVTEP